jgi:hypothetical protein
MRALRSLAFGASVLLTMLLLLVANLGVWAFSGLLDASALRRAASTALEDPAVRGYVSRQVGAQVASVVLDAGALPPSLRRVLDLPARPDATRLTDALTERIDGLLSGGGSAPATTLAAAALAQVVESVLEGDADPALTRDGLSVDLTPIGRLVLDSLDPGGDLAGALAPGTATIKLLDGDVVDILVNAIRVLDALRWMLPLACAVAIAVTLVLARYRVHALAWIGLCGVVAGTVSLLIASGGPVFVARTTDMEPERAAAVTVALDTATSGLVTQSAVLAGLGLALVVAGIAGGVVVSHDGRGRHDLRHGWHPGRLS